MPFRTSPDMAGAVMRGDVDVAFEFYAAINGLLADKKIVALASTGPKRTAYLPDVPTVIESGIKGYEVVELERHFGSCRYAESGHRDAQRRHERRHSRAPTCRAKRRKWAWRCAGARRRR